VSLEGPFLCDVMCGKLAVYLRMCGYDTAYALDREVEADDRVLALAETEGRTLLTRDRQLAERADGVLLTERTIDGQLRELRDAGVVLALAGTPAYCGTCNGPVEGVAPEESTPEYAPDARETDVWRCRHCGQYFWKGSHWDRVKETLRGR
jgi:uncharacterized protein with PIN domain